MNAFFQNAMAVMQKKSRSADSERLSICETPGWLTAGYLIFSKCHKND
jgi:hypothetical protein